MGSPIKNTQIATVQEIIKGEAGVESEIHHRAPWKMFQPMRIKAEEGDYRPSCQ